MSYEWVIMNYFQECYQDFPSGKLNKSEAPDFILKVNTRKSIGIELTQLHNPYNKPTRRENRRMLSRKEITQSLIQDIINKKEDKLSAYQDQSIQSFWLIIHADVLAGTETYNINSRIIKWKFRTPFEKVFLFDLFAGKIFKLN